MSSITIRNLDPAIKERLRVRAGLTLINPWDAA